MVRPPSLWQRLNVTEGGPLVIHEDEVDLVLVGVEDAVRCA